MMTSQSHVAVGRNSFCMVAGVPQANRGWWWALPSWLTVGVNAHIGSAFCPALGQSCCLLVHVASCRAVLLKAVSAEPLKPRLPVRTSQPLPSCASGSAVAASQLHRPPLGSSRGQQSFSPAAHRAFSAAATEQHTVARKLSPACCFHAWVLFPGPKPESLLQKLEICVPNADILNIKGLSRTHQWYK